ncbi:2-dehydro-3-deoxygalactonokinase [Paramixta manurensis]|uniref:2-dehydro-3-deoxygalactonokinase n=1 Tax=Paramixta manurensis TaxID=2740817 RepID=A0A6M8U682_9GAMM|nr:2-dehydro-3-deoxygalactonokinase [Erwiniaceae bacterium PD-1]
MTSYIAIDWGSTNLRAWRYENGECIDERRSEAGVTRLEGRTPVEVFDSVTAGWPVTSVPVVMAGMVGSNAGWLSVPYLSCPVSLGKLASQLTRVEDKAWIVPGLSVDSESNHNVMRGEETQLLGAITLAPNRVYVMPGTHSKWVVTEQDTVCDFRTVMTGELHHLLLRHSLVGAGLPPQQANERAFCEGLETGSNDSSILARLFEVRAAHVLGSRPREAVSEFLSGLLIGHEVALMSQTFPTSGGVTLIAGSSLAQRYQHAMTFAGLPVQLLDGDRAFQHGMRSIANDLAD